MLPVVLALTLALVSSGCSSGPKLYPNAKYEQVGKDGAEADIKDCEKKADDFLESSKGKKIAKSAGAGAVVGGAVGAVLGIFGGSPLRGAAIGAAAGGAGGAAHGALSPDEIKHRFIAKCLHDRGYEVLGWD